ncbi:DUF5056 domain-containing protein [Bacteroides sp.]
MMETDDKLLKQFFSEQKQEIEDRGFSERVMRNLPERRRHFSRVWKGLFCVLAVVLFLGLGGLPGIIGTLREVFVSMTQHAASGSFDPKGLIIAGVVLTFLGVRKVWSMT